MKSRAKKKNHFARQNKLKKKTPNLIDHNLIFKNVCGVAELFPRENAVGDDCRLLKEEDPPIFPFEWLRRRIIRNC